MSRRTMCRQQATPYECPYLETVFQNVTRIQNKNWTLHTSNISLSFRTERESETGFSLWNSSNFPTLLLPFSQPPAITLVVHFKLARAKKKRENCSRLSFRRREKEEREREREREKGREKKATFAESA